jgi:vacuolar-type H+-ATPase subunit C/Vma6
MSGMIQYSAVTTKVRAMQGKGLTAAQWQRLGQTRSLQGLWDILSKCPGWAAVGEQPRGAQSLESLTQSLLEQLDRDGKNLCHYLNREDSQRIGQFLKRRQAGADMTPEDYQKLWSQKELEVSGGKAVAGAEADAMNLVYILRLRRFPASAAKAKSLLIPVKKNLSSGLIDKLLAAKDDQAVLSLLQATRWGDVFTSLAPGDLEKEYRAYMEQFCRHIITSAGPGLAQVQAFLTLKDLERQRLTRLAAAVQRGLDPSLVI